MRQDSPEQPANNFLDNNEDTVITAHTEVKYMESIVFLGIQGSGKGTQAKILSKALNYQHVNIGDLLRRQIAEQTELGSKIKAVIARGDLVSDELVFRLIRDSISDKFCGIVFDGFPRTMIQAEYLIINYSVRHVIFLKLDDAEALARMCSRRNCPSCHTDYNLISKPPLKEGICDHCGTELIRRADDTEDAIQQRFKEFYNQTFGLASFFRERGLLREVSASGAVERIAADIMEAIQA